MHNTRFSISSYLCTRTLFQITCNITVSATCFFIYIALLNFYVKKEGRNNDLLPAVKPIKNIAIKKCWKRFFWCIMLFEKVPYHTVLEFLLSKVEYVFIGLADSPCLEHLDLLIISQKLFMWTKDDENPVQGHFSLEVYIFRRDRRVVDILCNSRHHDLLAVFILCMKTSIMYTYCYLLDLMYVLSSAIIEQYHVSQSVWWCFI